MCSFLVTETVQYSLETGSQVYAVSLDFSKAVDIVKYDFLFQSLIERRICPLICKFIWNIYCNARYCVKWNGVSSESFPVANGVKQGGVASPLLFTVVIDELIKSVRNLRTGCYIGHVCACIFVYADDVILLAPSRNAAQKLINQCMVFAV